MRHTNIKVLSVAIATASLMVACNDVDDPIIVPTADPSVTVTVTPSPSVTSTATPTVTNTITPTVTNTATVTVTPTLPDCQATEFVRGETRANNGEIYQFEGEFFKAQNSPGIWEAPKEGYFWVKVSDCNGSQPSTTVTPSVTTTPTVSVTVTAPVSPTPTQPQPGGLCKDFPVWTPGTTANRDEIFVVGNTAYKAKFYTSKPAGDPADWTWHLNCDGTDFGAPARLSMPNPADPVSLELPGWPAHLVVATPFDTAPAHSVLSLANRTDLNSAARVQAGFEDTIQAARTAGGSTLILRTDVLDAVVLDRGASLGSVAVQQALTAAAAAQGVSLSGINGLSNDAKGWANAHNLIVSQLAPNAVFGWELSIGSFAHDYHSGYRSVWDAASKSTADLLDNFGLYMGANAADFIAFTKSGSTPALNADQWDNALRFVKQVSDFNNSPAMLTSIPADQAGTYFLGATPGERKLRHAAHHNVFAVLFDAENAGLNSKIASYQQNTIPLYHTGGGLGSAEQLTRINAVNTALINATDKMNNEALLYQTPDLSWVPSTIYRWEDFLAGLNSMHNIGVAGNKFWLIDDNATDEQNVMYAKVAVAAFLAQSMQETIRYNACDENNWSRSLPNSTTDYPLSASCGQLEHKYADYGTHPVSGRDHAYSCARTPKMEVTATTNAQWYGAPPPIFAAPDSVLEEAGLLVGGKAGRWDHRGNWCNPANRPTEVDTSKQAWERDSCMVYPGQQAGEFVWDGSSSSSVEGCNWWGRGVIQTTGRQNFGTLNHFIGRSHVDPSTIGTVIDGVHVEAPPADPLYANLDLCSNPQTICTSTEHPELKWIAGLFYWVVSVQGYGQEGGDGGDSPWAGWNYYDELKAYVDGGLVGTAFIDAVSGIVNRGCPASTCPISGDVHAIEERQDNFKLVLRTLGLEPR